MPVSKTAASKRRVSKKKKSSQKNPPRKTSTYNRASKVHQDMLRNSSLSFAQATRKRKIDGRTVLHHFRSEFEKDLSGRIKARPNDRKRQILYIPGFDPGQQIPVRTKSASERRVVGRWMAALNAAGRGDFSKMDKFPRNKSIGGVLLPTNKNEVQRMLKALAEKESPFEGLYRTLARPS
jgi:hypothetical protein